MKLMQLDQSKINNVVWDIGRQLGVDFTGIVPEFYTDGATDAAVFSLGRQYLVKITDLNTIRTQSEFLKVTHSPAFQKLLCSNEALGYECFEFINGIKFDGTKIAPQVAVQQIDAIVRSYQKYPHSGYGFLNEEHTSWHAFLLDEIEYARRNIGSIPTDKVMKALEIAGRENPEQYLMHGDFGTHNFLLVPDQKGNPQIRVIDPMPVVGDPLYDFYFAVLSDTDIFTKVGADFIYGFFFGRGKDYKKALLTVALYVRMSRAWLYDREHFDAYVKLYERI